MTCSPSCALMLFHKLRSTRKPDEEFVVENAVLIQTCAIKLVLRGQNRREKLSFTAASRKIMRLCFLCKKDKHGAAACWWQKLVVLKVACLKPAVMMKNSYIYPSATWYPPPTPTREGESSLWGSLLKIGQIEGGALWRLSKPDFEALEVHCYAPSPSTSTTATTTTTTATTTTSQC